MQKAIKDDSILKEIEKKSPEHLSLEKENDFFNLDDKKKTA